ncbi:MAG: hypothetical protein AB4911_05415 [Oscillochloridaceae bacterium umkhey_bin13]
MLLVLTGCSQMGSTVSVTPRPTATIAPLFGGGQSEIPVVELPTPLPRTPVAPPASGGVVTAGGSNAPRDPRERMVEALTIFDERLDPAWTDRHSFNQMLNLQSRATASSGFTSLEAVPRGLFAGVFLTVDEEAGRLFPRTDVMGIRFNVSGGVNPLAPNDLIVKAVGSNRYPYFVENDASVPRPAWMAPDAPIFDEVGLGRLGLQRALQPGEWAEVTLWLDDYDQVDYRFLTGLIVMNDVPYPFPFYLDNIRLLIRRT